MRDGQHGVDVCFYLSHTDLHFLMCLFEYTVDIKGLAMAELTVCYIACFGLCKLCSRIHALRYQKALIIQVETSDVGTERCINTN